MLRLAFGVDCTGVESRKELLGYAQRRTTCSDWVEMPAAGFSGDGGEVDVGEIGEAADRHRGFILQAREQDCRHGVIQRCESNVTVGGV